MAAICISFNEFKDSARGGENPGKWLRFLLRRKGMNPSAPYQTTSSAESIVIKQSDEYAMPPLVGVSYLDALGRGLI
ncbi:MAG: hypothetical protein QGI09_08330 [Dehalococcoidia bacterium]|jgi:hypothetical protein|nr:hypothetical protein [Dehalococcoidia bacterium]